MGARGSQKNEERHAAILAAYESLGTLQKAGDAFGLTRERVRQIVKMAYGTGIQERRRVVVDAALDTVLPTALDMPDLAKQLGVSVGAVAYILKKRGTLASVLEGFRTTRAARREAARPHGTALKYRTDSCRCALCLRANADEHVINHRKKLGQDPFAPLKHNAGKDTGHIPTSTRNITQEVPIG
jgi:hypothetical protein